jgi:hypothetical protein
MKRKILLMIALIIAISCEKNTSSRNLETVTIQEFKIDDVSIRAIQIMTKNKNCLCRF